MTLFVEKDKQKLFGKLELNDEAGDEECQQIDESVAGERGGGRGNLYSVYISIVKGRN